MKAITTLIDHAREVYPHFESERGQRDILNATLEHGAMLSVLSAYHNAAKYHGHDTHQNERANSQRATAMLFKCMDAQMLLHDGKSEQAATMAQELLVELKAARHGGGK
jgi:hypothetical protein